MRINIRLLEHAYTMPTYAHDGDAGADLFCCDSIQIMPGATEVIRTGVCMAIPAGYEGQVRPRSSMIRNTPLTFEIGTIDSGYRGEIKIIVRNFSHLPYSFKRGDRIAQLVIAPVALAEFSICESLDETDRGNGGFGSTGK